MQLKTTYDYFSVPVLGIGTFGIGGGHEADKSRDNEEINAIKKALELGYRHIDTAELYGENHTEELVGKAIENYNWEELFLTSKVYKTNLKYEDVLNSAHNSLKRLNTSYIEQYLVHAFNPEIP